MPSTRRAQTSLVETFVVDATNQDVGVPQKLRVELDVVIHKARAPLAFPCGFQSRRQQVHFGRFWCRTKYPVPSPLLSGE